MSGIIINNRGTKDKPSWQFRFEMARIDGKRRYYSKAGFKTKKEAEKAGNIALADYHSLGQVKTPSEMSVSDLINEWLEFIKPTVSDSTFWFYSRNAEQRIIPSIGGYYIRDVSSSKLQEFISSVKIKEGLGKATVRQTYSIIKRAFSYALDNGYITSNPSSKIILPKFRDMETDEGEVIVLTKAQVQTLLDKFKRYQARYTAMLISYYTGMRLGEVMGLTWDDVDFDRNTITVNKQCKKYLYLADHDIEFSKYQSHEQKVRWFLSPCKTDNSNRTIVVNKELMDALADLKRAEEEQESLYDDLYTKTYVSDYTTDNGDKVKEIIQSTKNLKLRRVRMVCVRENGGFYGNNEMSYPTRVAKEKLGMTNFHFHCLRHTHATMLMEAGVPIKTISKRLGHASVALTLNIYVSVTRDMESKAIELFDQYSVL